LDVVESQVVDAKLPRYVEPEGIIENVPGPAGKDKFEIP
jgi:hypothetical protein